MSTGIALLSLVIVLYAAVATKLGRWSISMPMVFVGVGVVLGPAVTHVLPLAPQAEVVRDVTEIALALVLFTDASKISLKQVRADAGLLLRLLAIGLPLTIVLGTMVALGLFPGEGLAFCALLGSILAPTDASLGLVIFTNPQVPARIRRILNLESGLNDGIVTPIVVLCLAGAAATEHLVPRGWLPATVLAIALAVVVGGGIGVAGGWLLARTRRLGWTSPLSEELAILGLALAAYTGSVALQGNGFVAAFVGGIMFAATTRTKFAGPTAFSEADSTLLATFVWTIFGAVFVSVAFRLTSSWRPITYAVVSLTVVRMLPVAVALIGTRLRADTVAFMGWFGPRGLASVVFTLLAVVELRGAGRPIDVLVAVAAWTILLSVIAHGISAQPLAAWYSRRLEKAGGQAVEFEDEPARDTSTPPRRPSQPSHGAPRGHTTSLDSPGAPDTNLGAPV